MCIHPDNPPTLVIPGLHFSQPQVHPQPKSFPGFQLRRLIVEKWRIPSVADGDWRVQEAPIAPWREPPRSLSFKPLKNPRMRTVAESMGLN